jgi:acyl-CoA synthetase (AMP-forming)/AMP-acid ligase II
MGVQPFEGIVGRPDSVASMSFGAALAYRAEEIPEERAFTLLENGEEEQTLNFRELHQQAQNVAALLLEKMPADGRALLLFPPGLDYVRALYGCFQAGIVAVSAPPPQPNRLHRTLPRLEAIAADAEISAVLTIDLILQAAKSDAADAFIKEGPLTEVQWIATDTAPEGGEVEVAQPNLSDMCFLQYTSGSTRDPRGVVLSHENLMGNSDLITDALGHIPNGGLRKGLSWLPPYHDMGLIAGVLQPVHAGGLCVMMSPLEVIKRPARWLEAMTKYKVTTSGGPNFAYDLCVRRIDDETRDQLDLSEWEVAFNGAEPIRAETIDAFCEKFGPCGFKRDTFQTGYGLAEATLIVSSSKKDEEPTIIEVDEQALENGTIKPAGADAPSKRLVGSGATFPGNELAIADPETGRRCKDGEVGEIWFAGPGVANGYWRDPEETAEVFGARLADDPETPYLRSGDLGAILDGELYVVGRSKELIIVNGRNIYPHDIEFSAEAASPLVRSHCGAAFEMEVDGEIRIGILLEVDLPESDDGYEEIMSGVRRQVAKDLDLPLYWIGLCSRGTVPKTTSGKIQRRLSKAMVAERDVELLAEYPPREA